MISAIRRVNILLNIYSANKRASRYAQCLILPAIISNHIHTSKQTFKNKNVKDIDSSLVLHSFENSKEKKKEDFLTILREYVKNNTNRRGHLEFIKAALKYMDEFSVNKDIEVYKRLIDILPKGRYVATNTYQTLFVYYPQHQYTILDVLNKMEINHVIPDDEMEEMVRNIFGYHSLVIKKIWRMWYWMPKFAYLNPWPVSTTASLDTRALARFAIQKMCSIDVKTEITEFETKELKDSIDDTWIVSGMSSDQEELIKMHPVDKSLFVEGPFGIWVANQTLSYFQLRADADIKDTYRDIDDVSDIEIPFWKETKKEIIPLPTVHEQADGTYLALCCTGMSTKDSLLSWIRCLEKKNPLLKEIPIVFKLRSSTEEDLYLDNAKGSQSIEEGMKKIHER